MKRFHNFPTVLTILISFLYSACIPNDGRLYFINKSDKIISIECAQDSVPSTYGGKIQYYRRDSIVPNNFKKVLKTGPKDSWVQYVRNSPHKKLYIFVYDYDTLIKYNDMDTVRARKLYKELSFTEEELNKINWQIEYYGE